MLHLFYFMRYGRYGLPYFFLRVGLGLTFTWIGIDILRHPDTWIDYTPAEVGFGLSREGALSGGGVFDLVVGLLLLFQVLPKTAAVLAAVHLAAVIVFNGIDAILIRDLGLLGAALALALWPTRYHRRHGGWKINPFARHRHEGDVG